jgi:hypothetical protein
MDQFSGSGSVCFGPTGSASVSVCQRYGSEDPHPDPYQNVTDPQHWLKGYVDIEMKQFKFVLSEIEPIIVEI